MNDRSPILVTGATGFIGTHLAARLVEQGKAVRCLVRESSPKAAQVLSRDLGAALVCGDLARRESLDAAVAGALTVFHLGGGGSLGLSEAAARSMNVDGTRNLLDACVQAGNVRRVVHLSTCGVMGDTRGRPADETFPYKPEPNVYAKTKTEAEQAALSFRDRVPVTVVRFPAVYGPPLVKDDAARISGVTPLLAILAAVKQGQWRYIGDGKTLNDWLYVQDAVEGLELAAERGGEGEVYIVASGQRITMVEAIEVAAAALGVAAPSGHVPLTLARLLAGTSEAAARLLRTEPRMRREMVDAFLVNRTFDISKAQRELGYAPKVSLRQGLPATIRWFEEKGYL